MSHLLLSDADEVRRGTIAWLLRERGHEVTHVRDAAALPAVLERLAPAACPELVLLACTCHAGDGTMATLGALRADPRFRDLPVILASAPDPSGAPAMALAKGADDVVGHPITARELVARIDRQLERAEERRALRATLADRERELQRAREEVASSYEVVNIVHEVAGELSPAAIYRILARRVARALGISRCSVVLARPSDDLGTVVVAFEDPRVRDLPIRLGEYPELVTALESGRPVLVEDAHRDPRFAEVVLRWTREGRVLPIRSALALPFALDRYRRGVLFLRTERHERPLTRDDVDFGELVLRTAVSALRRSQMLESTRADNQRLEALATTDPLTRLLNRRALYDRLAAEVERAKRYEKDLAVLVLDLDHFKSVNDSLGHLVGDSVLAEVGGIVQANVRAMDLAARYGGEEFVIVLPETGREGAFTYAERVRERVAAHEFSGPRGTIRLTVSIGVAHLAAADAFTPQDLIARADEALYRAKAGGRNQVRT